MPDNVSESRDIRRLQLDRAVGHSARSMHQKAVPMRQLKLLFLAPILLGAFACSANKDTAAAQIGKEVYVAHCVTCHGVRGEGVAGRYPSLIRSSGIVPAQTSRAVQLIRFGSPLEDGMKPMALTSEEIVAVVNYIQNSWGNGAPALSAAQVAAIREP